MNRSDASAAATTPSLIKAGLPKTAKASPSFAASPESKLALAEFLLVSEDIAECAERSLEWLEKHAGVRKSVCLAVDSSQKKLVVLAAHGIPVEETQNLSLDLDDKEHPLVAALDKSKTVILRGSLANPRLAITPYSSDAFAAIQLGESSPDDRTPVGLLVVSPISTRTDPNLAWLNENLTPVVRRRLGARSLSDAERGLRRERTLLYNILNTVHD